MPEKEKYWYQDGGVVLLIVFLGSMLFIWIWNAWKEYEFSQRPMILPVPSGRLVQPLFGNPVLHMDVRHQFPGTLQNGQLTISTDSSMVVEGDQFQVHSFETWKPNRDNEVQFQFRLQNFDPAEEIPLKMRIDAKNGRAFDYTPTWLGRDWKANQEK